MRERETVRARERETATGPRQLVWALLGFTAWQHAFHIISLVAVTVIMFMLVLVLRENEYW